MSEPDMAWVVEQLERFVDMTTPHNLSGAGHITAQSGSKARHSEVLAEQDVVEAILNRFYPAWREENPPSRNYEWHRHREAAQRCLAQIHRRAELEEKLGFAGPRLQSDVLHPWVWEAARPQWESGHRAEAVNAAAKSINSRLQQKVGRRDRSDAKLVQEVFSLDAPKADQPRIRVTKDNGSETYRSLQEGVLQFGVGCFKAIRNPVAHLTADEVELTDQEALERLAALSLLARWIDEGELETAP